MAPKSQVDLEHDGKVREHLNGDAPEPDPDTWLEALTRQLYGNLEQEQEPTKKRRRNGSRKNDGGE
jgi:hypothetical protein